MHKTFPFEATLAIGPCVCLTTVWEGQRTSVWQLRDYDVITIARRGGFVLEWPKGRAEVPQGTAAIIPAGIQRRARQLPDCDTVTIATFNLHCRLLHGALTPFGLYATPAVLQGNIVQKLLKLHAKAPARPRKAQNARPGLAAHRHALDVLEVVLPQLPDASKPKSTQHDLTSLLNWLDTQLEGGVSVDDMAAHCDLSVSRFHRVFREQVGQTPQSYLRRKRLEEAARLLRNTDMNLGQIATRLGFTDAFHLSRLFKKEYGLAPAQFRHRVQVDFI